MSSTDEGAALVDFALARVEDRLQQGDVTAARHELARAQALLSRTATAWRRRERELLGRPGPSWGAVYEPEGRTA